MRLSDKTLASVTPQVRVPRFDRSAVTTGIVHLGVGGFHRAHLALYVDTLLGGGADPGWGICGVGVLPGDRGMAEVMGAQDGLYTLVEKHPDGTVVDRVIGSITDYLFAPDDVERVIERMVDPVTRIVSMTITEGGYHVDPATGEFDADVPAVRADLAPGAVPATVFGLVTAALARRRDRGIAPFTVMSCDNVQGNGQVAATAFTEFARLLDPALGDWIVDTVAFPSSMVDRITPATTDADRAEVSARIGVTDGWPVVCEGWTQFVLEDYFPLGRPDWQGVGVEVVHDVAPYERMKLRLLNAGHQSVAYVAHLSGHRMVHEAIADPVVRRLLSDYLELEGAPTLGEVPGIDIAAYRGALVERFGNPHVRDTVARLCTGGSDMIPTFLLPVVRHHLTHGGDVHRAALVVAAFARYCEGTDEQGGPIELVDRRAEQMRAAALAEHDRPLAFLTDSGVFGDLAAPGRFAETFRASWRSMHRIGVHATVAGVLDGHPA